MTISATTQGLRMGVATSTSRPTVPFDGQVISETDTDSLSVYKGTAWAPVSGLTFIKAQTIGSAVSSVTVTSCFNATYDNYLVKIDTTFSSNAVRMNLRGTGSTGTTYAGNFMYMDNSSGVVNGSTAGGTSYFDVGLSGSTGRTCIDVSLFNIFDVAVATRASGTFSGNNYSGTSAGRDTAANSSTGLDFVPASGTITGGTIAVYGYAKA